MRINPDPSKMNEQERAEWHDARSGEPRRGRVVKRHTKATADAHLSVRLYPDQIARLRQLARSDGASVSGLVRRIVEGELDRRLPMRTPTQNAYSSFVETPGLPLRSTGSAMPTDEIEQEFQRIA